MINIFISLCNNPFFWIILYLAGYSATIAALVFWGMEKITEKIPQIILKAFIVLIFVLPPVILPFAEGPKIKAPVVLSFLVGLIFLGAGIGIRVAAQKKINISLALRNKEKIVTTGVYGLMRHPLYLSNGLFAVGMAASFRSLDAFLFSILYTFLYLPVIYFEEKSLLKRYGEGYEDYRKRVGLFFSKRKKRN